jgi:predicted aspartyl protease
MPITFSRIQTSPGKPKPVAIKVLIDTGTSKMIVKYQHTHKLKHTKDYEEKPTYFQTTAGMFQTHAKAKIQFTLIEHVAHVAKDLSNYDMIIGRDLLHELGIDVKFSTKTMEWDGVSIPMKTRQKKILFVNLKILHSLLQRQNE